MKIYKLFNLYTRFIKIFKIILLEPSYDSFTTYKLSCKRIIIDKIYHKIWKIIYTMKLMRKWIKAGKTPPPPHFFKQKIVKAYAKRYSIDILIETGTYLGEMVLATKKTFKKIYSIELNESLYIRARKIFSNYNNVFLFHGDSGDLLPKILSDINQPCLFWLDAHYSGEGTARGKSETPVMIELQCILKHTNQNHVILIDDAHSFTGEQEYSTLDELKKLIVREQPYWAFIVKDNIIRIHKKR